MMIIRGFTNENYLEWFPSGMKCRWGQCISTRRRTDITDSFWIFSTVRVMLELHLTVKFLDCTFSIPIIWEDAAILTMLVMQYPQKQEENTLAKNQFRIYWKSKRIWFSNSSVQCCCWR